MSKIDYEFIKSTFTKDGYTLLSKKYVSSTAKLEYICPLGHKHSIKWNNFQQGQRCPYCYGNKKFDYLSVKEQFKKEGHTLLSKDYVNSKTKLNYMCDKGHISSINMENWKAGQRCAKCYLERRSGKGSNYWKGGVKTKDLPLYDTYAHQLEPYQPVYLVEQDTLKLLGVECKYCGNVHVSTSTLIQARVQAIKGNITKGEHHLYCSKNCKKACSTYNQKRYPKGFKPVTSREVQPELRKMVLARDDYQCQKCFKGLEEVQLHCHHIDPVINNPIESADIDNCIIYCKECHKKVHKMQGCTYTDLNCKE